MKISFLDVCTDVTKTAYKIPQGDYLKDGKYKIFDQRKDYVGGYRRIISAPTMFFEEVQMVIS